MITAYGDAKTKATLWEAPLTTPIDFGMLPRWESMCELNAQHNLPDVAAVPESSNCGPSLRHRSQTNVWGYESDMPRQSQKRCE
jgi:hypothetical protein